MQRAAFGAVLTPNRRQSDRQKRRNLAIVILIWCNCCHLPPRPYVLGGASRAPELDCSADLCRRRFSYQHGLNWLMIRRFSSIDRSFEDGQKKRRWASSGVRTPLPVAGRDCDRAFPSVIQQIMRLAVAFVRFPLTLFLLYF